MMEIFNNGTDLVIMGIIIALVGGWAAIHDYLNRKKEHSNHEPKIGVE